MREVLGDLFDYPADAIVIPINWTVTNRGVAVMGAGVARQAAKRFPDLRRTLGLEIMRFGEPQFYLDCTYRVAGEGPDILGVPTKRHWRQPSDMALIEKAAKGLPEIANQCEWQTVALPRIGCGLGGLDWESQVRPLLVERLDDRFVVVTP